MKTYTCLFTPDSEAGGYTVTCPALPGLVTEGDTLEEARAMAKDAIVGYLETLKADGKPLPTQDGSNALVAKIGVTFENIEIGGFD